MISSLNGRLIYTDAASAVVECGGVGLKCSVTSNTLSKLPRIGENVFLYTVMTVKEDAISLYGFLSVEEIETFKMLTSVSGIGPKTALAVLSEFTPERITLLILSGDAKGLTTVSGLGLKSAQRIILELKDKFGKSTDLRGADLSSPVATSQMSNAKEAMAALVSLGFSNSDALSAVGALDPSLDTQQLIKLALKQLSKR